MVKIAIVEDEREYSQQLEGHIRRYAAENRLAIDITLFWDGREILEGYRPGWDIIFLDIKMPDMDGMTAAKEIRRLDGDVVLIFITMMAQYAVKGYQVEALDFVLKPVNYVQVETKMKKALNRLQRAEQGQLLLPARNGQQRVNTSDVCYVEVKNHTLHVVTDTGEYVLRGTLREAEKMFGTAHFGRCHNSYLVNLKNVTGVQRESVQVGTHTLPVSRPRKKQFLQQLSDYWGEGYRDGNS